MITTILIDDERDALDTLSWQLNTYCQEIRILDRIYDPQEAPSIVAKHQPDCLFLDISMPNLTGFDLLKFLECSSQSMPQIIFTTGHEEHALRAIKISAFDYLLKPIDKDDLINSVVKLKRQLGLQKHPPESSEPLKRVQVSVEGAVHFLHPDEIVFLQAESNYTTIHLTSGKKMILCKTLKEVQGDLSTPRFFRAHKSFLVNLTHVSAYRKSEGGCIIMSNGTCTPISRNKKNLLLQMIG